MKKKITRLILVLFAIGMIITGCGPTVRGAHERHNRLQDHRERQESIERGRQRFNTEREINRQLRR